MRKRNGLIITLITCVSIIITGCTAPVMQYDTASEPEFLSMNREPELYFATPLAIPHIIVDRFSYGINDEKQAFFMADTLPAHFEVVDATTGKTVFHGNIKTKKNPNANQQILGYGDFSEITQPGQYYITTQSLGQSYTFSILEDGIREGFEESLDQFGITREKKRNTTYLTPGGEPLDRSIQGGWLTDEFDNQDMIISCEAMTTLLGAYELYSNALNEFTTDAGEVKLLSQIYHQSIWMLSLQDELTGGVYGGVTGETRDGQEYEIQPITCEASAAFATAMAKFSYIYKDVNPDYASLCLKAADLAFKYVEKAESNLNSKDLPYRDILAAASVELYRASGLLSYFTYTDAFLPKDADPHASIWNHDAVVTYMYTRKAVNIDKCSNLMKNLMKTAEGIASVSRQDAYYVSTVDGDDSVESLLWNMVILSSADYVLTNSEYANVILNHQHYFRGRNYKSMDYIKENNEYKLKDLRSNAKYIYMLSQILSTDYFIAPSDNDY